MAIKLSDVRDSGLCPEEYRDRVLVPQLEQKLGRGHSPFDGHPLFEMF